MSLRTLLLSLTLLLTISVSRVYAQSAPAFSTQAPLSGEIDGVFVAFVPLFNTGTGPASNVQVTSVSFGIATPTSPTLPMSVGTLSPGGHNQLDLRFASLTVGATYLLTIRGTYQVGENTMGFAVNRFLTVSVPTGSVRTELRRWIVLDAVKAKFASRSRLDPIADNQEMLSFLRTFPDFVDSGADMDTTSVWATFADGQALVIANDRPVPTSSRALLQASTPASGMTVSSPSVSPTPPTELPQSKSVRLLNTLLGPSWDDPKAVSEITSSLNSNGYTSVKGADASVNSLKTVGGDGVFYIASHAGGWSSNAFYSVWTSTVADILTDALLDADLNPPPPLRPTLYRMLADVTSSSAPGGSSDEYHYSFNSRFVRTYFKNFASNSFVYIDACNSEGLHAGEFKQAFFEKNASVYAGWAGTVGDTTSADTARLVFERLLGANRFCPEDGAPECSDGPPEPPVFAQRAFDWMSVEGDLRKHSLGFDPPTADSPGATLSFDDLGPGAFGLLAPSISNMQVDETMGAGGQLTINGIFGADPGAGSRSVQVGGANANVVKWQPKQIVVDLTLSGPGSSGDVLVKVRNHKSNVARLTDWRSNSFVFTYKENGSLQKQITYNMHFRADMRKYRKVIHKGPSEPSGGVATANDSTATFIASGSGPGTAESFSLKGSGSLLNVLVPSGVSDNFFGLAAIIGDSKNMTFQLVAISTRGCTCTVCTVAGCVNRSNPVFGPSNSPNFSLLFPFFVFVLDDSATIQAAPPPPSNLLSLVPLCNRDIKVATGQLQWGSISAGDTAPDPNSAR